MIHLNSRPLLLGRQRQKQPTMAPQDVARADPKGLLPLLSTYAQRLE